MNKISKTNKYFDSDGHSYTQGQVNANITKAKERKLNEFFDEHGYHFCEQCRVNSSNSFKLDCSHQISVKEAKETKQVQLAWTVSNIKLLCRRCHQIKDKLC